MNIKYVKNSDINYYRWDKCISISLNGLIYGYSWYLNTVCNTWDALIEEDYSAVMPLPLSKRYGIERIKTPCFINQLGIFSPDLLSSEKINEFLQKIPSQFKYIDLNINKFNIPDSKKITISEKSHFELDLIKNYDKIRKNYSESLKNKLIVSEKNKLSVIKGIQPSDFIDIIETQPSMYCQNEDHLKLIRMLVSTSLKYRFGEIYGVYDRFNTLVSTAFFLWSHNKSILLYALTKPEKSTEFAFHYLIDRYLYNYSGRYITLSFDFSLNKEMFEAYKDFGAIESKFHNIKKYRIPFLSFFKK